MHCHRHVFPCMHERCPPAQTLSYAAGRRHAVRRLQHQAHVCFLAAIPRRHGRTRGPGELPARRVSIPGASPAREARARGAGLCAEKAACSRRRAGKKHHRLCPPRCGAAIRGGTPARCVLPGNARPATVARRRACGTPRCQECFDAWRDFPARGEAPPLSLSGLGPWTLLHACESKMARRRQGRLHFVRPRRVAAELRRCKALTDGLSHLSVMCLMIIALPQQRIEHDLPYCAAACGSGQQQLALT
jgi:hypothetical protein